MEFGRKCVSIAAICLPLLGVQDVLATTQPVAISVDDVA